VKPKTYSILDRCVEEGIARGMNRAYKYVDSPNEEQIKEAIHNCVMSEICEWFSFDESGGISDE
jgi:hypothetical protein